MISWTGFQGRSTTRMKAARISPIEKLFLLALPFVALNTALFFASLPSALAGFCDFRHLYTAGYMVRSGQAGELYDYEASRAQQNRVVSDAGLVALPFNHLAYEALIFFAFSFLSYRKAYAAFVVLNLILLAVSMRILRPHFRELAGMPRWIRYALPIGFLPAVFTLNQGQDSIILLVLACCAFVLLDHGHDAFAGAALALMLFKFQFPLAIVFLYLCWKKFRFVGGFIAAGAVLIGMSYMIVGPHGAATYTKELVLMSVHLEGSEQLRYGIYPEQMMNLRGFVHATTGGHGSAIQIATVMLSLIALTWAARARPSLPLAIVVAVLVSYHCFLGDGTLLLIPIAILAGSGSVLISGIAIVAPTILMFAGNRYWLMVIPLAIMARLLDEEPNAKVLQRGARCYRQVE